MKKSQSFWGFLLTILLLANPLFISKSFAAPGQAPTTRTANDNASAKASQLEEKVVQLVNEERKKHGLQPLQIDVELAGIARDKSKEMRDQNYYDHTSPSGVKYCDKVKEKGISDYCGENIAAAIDSAEKVMEKWMNSPGHRANILKPEYTHIGVGFAEGGGQYNQYWTQLFVRK